MKFAAIDVETANPDFASICSIGVAVFENGELASEWSSLINPKDYFDPFHESIHGIKEKDVRGKPTFKMVATEIDQLFGDMVIVTHTHFDRVAIHRAAAHWSIPAPSWTWLDSARVARRTWSEFAQSGYGLPNVCEKIGYSFKHHDALEDAKAAGQIILAAMHESGLDLDAMLKRVEQPIDLSRARAQRKKASFKRDGNPDGPLAGEVIVFTGTLEVPRREAADIASFAGCQVADSVTKNTTLLVVGDIDTRKLAGYKKTSKHRKAEKMAAAGSPIRIIYESDFQELINSD